MPYKTITLSLSAELLPIINEAAKANYCTRSDYIRESVVQKLKEQYKDLRNVKIPGQSRQSVNPKENLV